jgi:hypothetical protein
VLRDSSSSPETGEGSKSFAEAGDFGSLFEGLTAQRQQDGAKVQISDCSSVPLPINEGEPAAEAVSDIAGSVFVLLEGFLPRALPQTGVLPGNGQERSSDGALSLALQELQQPENKPDLAQSPLPPRMMVSVQHQETHFRPILEGSDAISVTGSPQEAGIDPDQLLPDQPSNQIPRAVLSGGQRRPSDSAMKSPEGPLAITPASVEKNAGSEEHIESLPVEKIETFKPSSLEGKHEEPQGLPPATLHRLTNALGHEVKALTADASIRFAQSDRTPQSISIKASESALRVLNLQLHPAELGTVTVKMKLAGDALEMELHVEKEETAQLLRHDSEKLSALLRGSGYRPDVVSIQVTDSAIPDRSSTPKMQTDMQFQGQSFSQDGASQDERSRNREESYVSTRSEQNKGAESDSALGHLNRGGVYL